MAALYGLDLELVDVSGEGPSDFSEFWNRPVYMCESYKKVYVMCYL